MTFRPSDLPDFENPPLTEVVLSVEIADTVGLTAPYVGVLWNKHFRTSFPRAEQHPPVLSTTEHFSEDAGPPPVHFKIVQSNAAPAVRCWFITNNDNELIQIQSDRFTHNWRKRRDSDLYPRYEYIREQFENEYRAIDAWLRDEGREGLMPTQAEITYVNHISSGGAWKSHDQIHKVFAVMKSEESNEDAMLEGVEFARHYVLKANNQPYARLHIAAVPILKVSDRQPGYKVDIVVRGAPFESTLDGVMSFFDAGRNAIVRKFDEITTVDLHAEWGKK